MGERELGVDLNFLEILVDLPHGIGLSGYCVGETPEETEDKNQKLVAKILASEPWRSIPDYNRPYDN